MTLNTILLKERKEEKQNLHNQDNLDCIMLNTDVSNRIRGLIMFLRLSENTTFNLINNKLIS